MRTKAFPLLALAILTVCIIISCKKNKFNPNSDNGLPPATQTGADVFACKANGEPAISKGGAGGMNAGIYADSFYFFGSRITIAKYYGAIRFSIKEKPLEGMSYQLKTDLTNSVRMDTEFDCFGNWVRGVNSFYSGIGNIKITKLDTVKRIFSGTFDCIVPIPNCDTVKVTDGRFDMRYY